MKGRRKKKTMPYAQCPMPHAQNDLISQGVPQPEVGACCPNLSNIEATATKLIANSADV
ncbi:hypothetical protein [Microcoleus sp. B13-B4]|uniref:hypothetical protein n=1 Tax=Microcoleus sp. B13-B4 TaxID=2818651 RepID=UPI002FD69447